MALLIKSSRFFLVRHGQACFGTKKYDRLSALGESQLAKLGRYWRTNNLTIDTILSGQLDRQRHSASCMAAAYGDESLLTRMVIDSGFDEYRFEKLVKSGARYNYQGLLDWDYYRINKTAYLDLLRESLMSVSETDLADWRLFKNQSVRALQRAAAKTNNRNHVVIFSSAGTIAAILQHVDNMTERQTFAVATSLFNSSVSTLDYDGASFKVININATDHLSGLGLEALLSRL